MGERRKTSVLYQVRPCGLAGRFPGQEGYGPLNGLIIPGGFTMKERVWIRRLSPAAVVCLVTASAIPVAIAAQPPQAAERFGGIEIGAKGVKATVVEVAPGTSTPPKAIMSSDYISNTTLAEGVVQTKKFSSAAIQETAEEAAKFAQRIRQEFDVAPERIRVVGSSGLPKDATNRDELVSAVQTATGLAPMTFLDPAEEVKLTILGLLSATERGNSLLVDVGSGNTKGGLLQPDDSLVYFAVPVGSVTYANRVTQSAPGKPFAGGGATTEIARGVAAGAAVDAPPGARPPAYRVCRRWCPVRAHDDSSP